MNSPANRPTGLRALPATVWLVGVISLLNDAASEMVYPLVPLYLTSVLLAGPKALGLIEGIAEATASFLKLISGVLVDRHGNARRWIVAGYGLAAFSRPLIGLARQWPLVLLLRFADRVGKGLRTSPRDALLAASVPADQRGLAFGFHRALDNAGAVIGPLAAAALLADGHSLSNVFHYAALPGLLAWLVAWRLPRSAPVATQSPRPVLRGTWANLPPAARRYLGIVGLFTLGNASNMFLLLRARELGLDEALVPLLWAGTSLVAALLSTPLSGLSDRVGRERLLICGWLAYAVFYFSLALIPAQNHILVFVLFAGYGVFLAATEGAERAKVADLVPAAMLGSAYGWFNLVCGLALLPASFLFGVLYERSAVLALGFSATCAILAAMLLARRRGDDSGRRREV